MSSKYFHYSLIQNFESPSPKNALCKVCLQLTKCTRRRKWKCAMFTDRQADKQTDRWRARWRKNHFHITSLIKQNLRVNKLNRFSVIYSWTRPKKVLKGNILFLQLCNNLLLEVGVILLSKAKWGCVES